jgi:1-acyl-sn-glycerol-3-phosphate acyltransferase
MLERINYAWRVLATGLSFLSFGVGGVLLWLLVFPPLEFFVRDPARRGRYARAIIHRSFAGHIGLMHRLGVLTYEIRGIERLQRKGLLVLANHPTLIDVVFLVSLIPNADCVVKSRLASNPFTRGPVRATGYICNDNGAGLVDDCIASVRSGKNLLIFPEGTRTPRSGPSQLQRGAANIAVRGVLDVTPVLIKCDPPTLSKGEKWYRIPSRRFHVVIEVREDLPVASFLGGTTEAIASRRLTDYLTTYFARG